MSINWIRKSSDGHNVDSMVVMKANFAITSRKECFISSFMVTAGLGPYKICFIVNKKYQLCHKQCSAVYKERKGRVFIHIAPFIAYILSTALRHG